VAGQRTPGPRRAAVLSRGPWTDDDRAVWESMTDYPTPTAATLCEFAREVLSDERMRSQGLPRPPPPPEEPR